MWEMSSTANQSDPNVAPPAWNTPEKTEWLEKNSSLIIIFLLIILVLVVIVIAAIICIKRKFCRRQDTSGCARCVYNINKGFLSDHLRTVECQGNFYKSGLVQCQHCVNQQQFNGSAFGEHAFTHRNNSYVHDRPLAYRNVGLNHDTEPPQSNVYDPSRIPIQNICEPITGSRSSCDETGKTCSDSENQSYNDQDETQPMTISNQELFANIPSQLLIPSERSKTITVQNKEVVFIARRVTEKGDNLVLDQMGISLFVPPGAVKSGEVKTIVLVLNWDLSDNPNMTEKQALVSPVVYVGPHDLKLEKQCTLSFKHCSFDPRQIKVLKSETELTEAKDWNEYCNSESDTGTCVITPDECKLQIDTFTLYTCVQSPNSTDDCRKWLQVAAFSSPLKSSVTHQQIRLYFLNKTPCALQWAIQNEAKFGGQMMGPEKVYLFYGNAQNMFITLRYLSEGWENADTEVEEHIPYINIWHGKCPHISMCFKKKCYPRELSFKLFIYQYLLENEGENFTAHITEDNKNEPSKHEIVLKLPGRPNNLSDCGDLFRLHHDPQVHIHFRSDERSLDLDQVSVATKGYYPHDLKVNLKVLLDPSCPFDKNWRALAAALDKEGCIRYLETKDSPTELLLTHAESRKISLETLADIMRSIQREDAAQLVKDYIPQTGNKNAQNKGSRAVENTCAFNFCNKKKGKRLDKSSVIN